MSQSSAPNIFRIIRRVHNLATLASSEGMIMITVRTIRSAGDLVAVSACSCAMLQFLRPTLLFGTAESPPDNLFQACPNGLEDWPSMWYQLTLGSSTIDNYRCPWPMLLRKVTRINENIFWNEGWAVHATVWLATAPFLTVWSLAARDVRQMQGAGG